MAGAKSLPSYGAYGCVILRIMLGFLTQFALLFFEINNIMKTII